MVRSKIISLFACVLLAAPALSVAQSESSADEQEYLFYPSAPAPARLQYLARFSSAYDVALRSSSFRDFVFGGEEYEEQAINKPFGLAVYDGAIYAVDTRGNGYVVFDVAKGKWRKVAGSGRGSMKKPINIEIDKDGTRYVTDTERNAVLVFNSNDKIDRVFGEKGQFRPIDVAISGDRLYVSDSENNKIHVLNKYSGESLFTFGGSGAGEGKLVHPTSLAIGYDESIYVTDTTNFRIQKFSLDGEFLGSFGKVGTNIGSFARPKGVDVDKDGNIYVVDAAFQNVQILNDQGQPLLYFGGAGSGKGKMNLPTVVKIDYDNVEHFRKYAAPGFDIEYLVLVANQFGNNKVMVYGFGAQTE